MSAFIEEAIIFATESTLNTLVCVVAGTFLVYYLFFFDKKKGTKVESKLREIKKEPIKVDQKKEKEVSNLIVKEVETLLPKKQQEPFLARFEATQAICLLEANKYIGSIFEKKEKPNSFFDDLLGVSDVEADSGTAITRQAIHNEATTVVEEVKEEKEELSSGLQATENNDIVEEEKKESLVESEVVPVEPFLAAYEATVASTTLEAQQYISALPKPPRPFLAAFEATTATTTMIAREYVNAMPKPPRPFLAAFEATTASNLLAAQTFAASLPKPSKPFLAHYEATTAQVASAAQEYAKSLPKPSKPFLAAFEATTAQFTQIARDYVAALPKPPKPFLAAFEATTASTTCTNQQYITDMVKSDSAYIESLQSISKRSNTSVPSNTLASYEATAASILSISQEYIQNLTASVEYPKANINVKATESEEKVVSSMDEEAEELSSTSSLSEASTSSLPSEAPVSASDEKDKSIVGNEGLQVDVVDQTNARSSEQFKLSWDDIYSGDNNKKIKATTQSPSSTESPTKPWMSTTPCIYYPNCTNKNCKFIHPGPDNNPRPKPKRAATVNAEPKRLWTRPELIERQSQTHFPIWKSRCVHWPYCTNKHCKYSHPIKECR
ncbi:uncharacterized protein B0P05DRAFT_557168 [Gilbertella persicaria]|uniref:uncharacterized protein n=1 Tax=Gilbertella persicaria TaxID=101096 RepID=UPI002220A5B4|nr:uncharacterized protein B0P05DRAFT_557168 [Gilbertella persicaria]KAI8061478.1 hypothetical protein B0P05DRAFT_557168 [Gilbertella persicaria]